jgi:hypothetical protein
MANRKKIARTDSDKYTADNQVLPVSVQLIHVSDASL